MSSHVRIITLVTFASLTLLAGCSNADPTAAPNAGPAAAGAFDAATPLSERVVKLPRRIVDAREVLEAMHTQAGVRFAFTSRSLTWRFDATRFDGQATVAELVPLLAERATWVDGVLLLEAKVDDAELRRLADQLAGGDADARRTAAYLLGNTRSTRAIAPLAGALSDRDESVRHHALRSLDRLERDMRPAIGNDRPLPLTQYNYKPAGRVSIFQVVKNLPAEPLARLLRSAPHPSSNQWLWSAGLLARVGGDAKLLEPGLKMGYQPRRALAAWAAAQLNPPGVSPADPPPPTFDESDASANRARELLALGDAGGKAAWDALLGELDSADATIRRAAIRGLRNCPDPRAVDPLVAILTGPDAAGDDRDLAAQALGLIGSDAVVAALTDYVNKSPQPISTTPLALGYTMRPDAVPALAKCLKSNKTSLHYYAYLALWQIGTPDAVAAVLTTYNEHDNTARFLGHSAVRLAGHNQAGLDYLVDWVNKGTSRITVHGLEMCEDPRAVDALLATIPDSKDARLQYAVQALGRIGDPKAVPLLAKLLDHDSEMVAYDAMRQLRWRWYFHRDDVRAALAGHPLFKAIVATPPSLEDQPENTWVLRHWPVDLDDYRAVNTSYEAGMAFDTKRGQVIKWGAHGQRCDTPQLGETWLYDPGSNQWTESSAPVQPFGMCGTWGIIYDPANDAVVSTRAEGNNHGWQWDRGENLRQAVPWVYAPGGDRWTPMKLVSPGVGPGLRGFSPLAYHPGQRKVMLWAGQWGHGKGDQRSRMWTYDTHANTWTELPLPEGDFPPARAHQAMCYLPNVDRMLMVGGNYGGDPKQAWLYDLDRNAWTKIDAKGEIPRFRLPMRYDPVTGRALHFGAHAGAGTHVHALDPKKSEWSKVPDPAGMTPHHDSVDVVYDPGRNVYILDGGHLGWNTDHLAVREVWTYRHKHRDGKPAEPKLGTPPTTPAVPTGVVVSVRGDRTVEVRWDRDKQASGYHLYAADVKIGRMHPWSVWEKIGEFKRVTDKPVPGGVFVDARPLAETDGAFNHAIRVYQVTAVGPGGESGPSAQVLALTSAVPSVSAVERPDGSTLITWGKSSESHVRGYRVYRMDVARGSNATLLTPSPVVGNAWIDRPDAPRSERRRYYVVAVDALGQEGLPSTGAWAFGRP